MSEHLLSRQRRRELLITLSFTIFTALMIIISPIQKWPFFYIPILILELAYVWWSYIRGFQSYSFRAFVLTFLISLNVFLYGIQGEDFFVLIPTLCVEFVLLSLYEITRIMDIVITKTILLFLYHIFVKGYDFTSLNTLERNRVMLQAVSYIVLMGLCLYRIHHHHQEEDDVVNLEERVEREQRIRGDFIANTSHELRTPVNTVSGLCEIMLQKNLPDDIHSSVLDIQMTGVELQNIVTDILDYADLEADTMVLHPRVYNITSTLNDVMNMTVFENRSKQLEIIFDCDPNIPSQLEGDEQQLRRILKNLIGNAIKYTAEGGVIVRVTYRPEAYGINLIVSVKDTGVGMSQEDQELILRGFYQSDMGRSRKGSGLGLGLPITSALIKKMGGFLIIKSEKDVGSEFSFAIPQKVVSEEPCISLLHPGSIKLIWYYNTQSSVASMRDAFADHIRHFSDSFGIISHRATSLEECRRRISQTQGAHLILGQEEYLQDREYFDKISVDTPIILVADRSGVPNTGANIHVLYKPYNAIMLAEIFNGSHHKTTAVHKKELKRFIAPTAKILVVDDNLMNLKVVEGLLRKYRIRVVAATSGDEALSLIDSQDYDFVFMDHMMPGMDGVECYHRIREKHGSYFAKVPIIALTANAIAGSREMFLSEGFSEFVAKPIDTALLNEVLYRFIPLEKQLTDDDIRFLTQDESATILPEDKAAASASSRDREKPVSPRKEDAPPQKAVASPEESYGLDPFDQLPDIDKEMALTYCGSTEDFLELAQVYLSSGRKYQRDLEKAFQEMNLKSYALLSHTVKGTSKTLGLTPLSDLAFKQESAAKEERAGDLRDQHDDFMEEYGRILDQLGSYFGESPEEEASEERNQMEEISGPEIQDWESLKSRLMDCLEAYEEKAFGETLDTVKGHTLLGRPVRETLSEVLDKVAAFDFEGALECLEEIGGTSC